MRILILHPNFPGQFLRHCSFLGLQGVHDIRFICHYHHDRHIQGVVKYKLKNKLGAEFLDAQNFSPFDKVLATADQYFLAMLEFSKDGWIPDLILSHSGWGCGIFAKKVFPSSCLISYLEWWFDADKVGPSCKGLSENFRRNLSIGNELIDADLIVAPTQWQADQLPSSLQLRTKVLYDGVDLDRFSPSLDVRSKQPLLTYGTRGMEPIRGFPQFIRELPNVLNKYPELTVQIAGEDRICYGGKPPSRDSYGNWAKDYLNDFIDAGRVVFIGTLGPVAYCNWLKESWFHVYLTQPYVLSWSLLEAMASGCTLIVSDTQPVREFLDNDSAVLVNMDDMGWLQKSIDGLFSSPDSSLLGINARKIAIELDEKKAWRCWYDTIVGVL